MSIQAQLEGVRAKMLALADIAAERKLTDEENTKLGELRASKEDLEARQRIVAESDELRKTVKPATNPAAPQAAGRVEVEARSPYAKDAGTSWFNDLTESRKGNPEAVERLKADAQSRADEASYRGVESRTYSAGTNTEGGYLVPPVYLQDAFVDLVAAGRTTADLCQKMPLPEKTASVNIPTQSGATAVAVHTENAAVTETTAAFSTINAVVKRIAGAGTVPNFLLDRSMPGVDQIILKDLAKRYAIQVDDIVLDQNDTGMKGILRESGTGGATATAATADITHYWPAFLNAYNDVASGVYEAPSAIVMHPRRWAYLASLRDSTTRPLLSALDPQNAIGGFNGMDNSNMGPRPTGSLLGVPVYLDSRVPVNKGAGTDEDVIIFGRFDEAWLMEATPKFAISTEAEFLNDQTLVKVTNDVAFTCARRAAAFSIVSGTALNDTV